MSQATKATSLRVWLMLGAVLLLGAVLRFQAISNTVIDPSNRSLEITNYFPITDS